MKKIIVPVMFVLSLILCSCSNDIKPGASHFKEYTFSNVADSDTQSKIKQGLTNNATMFSKIKFYHETYSNYGSAKYKYTYDMYGNVYDDPNNMDLYIVTAGGTMIEQSSSNGANIYVKEVVKMYEWDGGDGYSYQIYERNSNGDKSTEKSKNKITMTSKQYKDYNISLNGITQLDGVIYKNKDKTYTCVEESDISKKVVAVQWGSGTKEQVTIYKRQTIYSIDKEYRIKSGYSYSEHVSNRDPDTGEWFDEEKIIESSYFKYTFEYGRREKKSVETLNNLYEKTNNDFDSGNK